MQHNGRTLAWGSEGIKGFAGNNRAKRGFFLIELLVACAVFMVFVTITMRWYGMTAQLLRHAQVRMQLLEQAKNILETGSTSQNISVPLPDGTVFVASRVSGERDGQKITLIGPHWGEYEK